MNQPQEPFSPAPEGFRDYLILLARGQLGDQEQARLAASDIVQQTLLEAHQKLHQFRGASNGELAAWLLGRFDGRGWKTRGRSIEELNDAEKYVALNRIIINATSLDDVRRACTDLAAPAPRRKKAGHGRRGSSKA